MDCAFVAGAGPVRRITPQQATDFTGPGFVWVHLHGKDDADLRYLRAQPDVPDVAAAALVATETRPRCDRIEEGALINLRGPGEEETRDSDRLVSIRMWVRDGRATSLSRRRMRATADVIARVEAGLVSDPGDLVAAYAKVISAQLDPQVAALGDALDEIESALEVSNLHPLRRQITRIRSEAIAFRRFVAPNRDALLTLGSLDFGWLADEDRLHIGEAADRFARMAEELEAVRERAALLHEQITDLRAEQVDERSLYIAVIAFVFLPLTFITGLLGMNVAGIPFADRPWAFWGVVAFCVALGLAVLAWFLWRHWLKR